MDTKIKPFFRSRLLSASRSISEHPFSKATHRYPLEVVKCDNCHSQLNYTCSGKILYQQDYPYESDITKQGETLERICKRV